MPSYKCSRFNRSANVPSRMCECGLQAINTNQGAKRRWVCPQHGDSFPIKLCDCDGCQKSYTVKQNYELRHRLWKMKGHFQEYSHRDQYLFRGRRYQRKYEQMQDEGGLPFHICPKCNKYEPCSEPFRIKPDCKEKIPKPKDLYAHCPINEAIEKGEEATEWWDRRACGGFWPSNPFTKDEELQEHIFYFHDASRSNLIPEVETETSIKFHKCRYIIHFCTFCHAIWESTDRLLSGYGDKENSRLGTSTTFKHYHKGRQNLIDGEKQQ